MDWVKDYKQTLQWVSFLLVILAFPLLTWGVRENELLAWAGLAMVVLGFVLPPLMRLLAPSDDDDAEEEDS